MILSILIPTIERHKKLFDELMIDLLNQQQKFIGQTEILVDDREGVVTGTKRNNLISLSKGKYIAFIDSDDKVPEDYLETVLPLIETGIPDCLSLRGIMTTDGKNPEVFEHSIKYSKWRTTDNYVKYERYPNHLNVIRSTIARQFKFPEITIGEDHVWSTKIHESGLLKNEVFIDKVLYYYKYVSKKGN